jgi:hypothetical protein
VIAVHQLVGTTDYFGDEVACNQADKYGKLRKEYQFDHDLYVASGEASPVVETLQL